LDKNGKVDQCKRAEDTGARPPSTDTHFFFFTKKPEPHIGKRERERGERERERERESILTKYCQSNFVTACRRTQIDP